MKDGNILRHQHFLSGSSCFSDKIFGQYEWQGLAFENLRKDNNFADVTLACEDCQKVEAHKVILAGQWAGPL